MRKKVKSFSFLLVAAIAFFALSVTAQAAPTLVSPSPNSFGEIERITLNDPANVYSGGVMVVGGIEMILPKNLLIDLPANRLSLQQIFDQAPAACKTLGESGLAKADACNLTGSGGIATLSATRTNAGNVIVGDLFIQKAAESVHGVVTYINYDQGYYRVNGIPNDPATGAMVRLNDPNSRHTVQNGAGCSAGSLNCSPDPRFNLDPDNYTNTFATGYPICIPSTVSRSFTNVLGNGGLALAQANADGTGDFLCPDTNRTAALVEPAVADSRRFAPVIVGDTVLAEGNYESVGGVRFLSAHSSSVQKALSTRNATGQPDYLFLEEVGYEAPPYQNQRLIALLIGFTTLANPATDVDVWSLHRDPTLNEIHEFPFATVRGCDAASGGVGSCSNQGLVGAGLNIFKIRYDIDFLVGPDPKLSPCAHLANPASRFFTSHPGICSGVGNATTKDIAVMSPVPHEIIARTGRKIDSATNAAIGELITIDINGNPATNGEYLFPLGLNLGGLGVAEMSEVNINELNTPIPFEGITWNLDRRLGPSGCLNAGGCEAGTVGSAAFALDPFPFSGLDPRLQASNFPANATYSDPIFSSTPLTNSRDRMFSYVLGANFGGNATVLPYSLGVFPTDPALIPINPTPPLTNLFPPVARNDAATIPTGSSISIPVIANDTAIAPAAIDPATLAVNAPTGGMAAANIDGTVTYTAPAVAGTYTFRYNVKDTAVPAATSNLATVTVTVPLPAAMISPANGSTLAGATQTFTWSNGSAENYQLWVGTALGKSDIGVFHPNTATTIDATGLPINGSTIYVRLYSKYGATWVTSDYTYKASVIQAAAAMISPANASTLAGTSRTFTWNNVNAEAYQLWVGTAPGKSNIGVFRPGKATTTNVTGLPVNASTVYVRLSARFGTTWLSNDYTYTAAGSPPAAATMTSPLNAATLAGTSQTFTWNNVNAAAYQLWVGTAPGKSDIGIFRPGTATTTNVTGLPANGSTIYVRLSARFGTTWLFNDYTYTAAALAPPAMISPANASTLAGATQTFSWSNANANSYQLWVGTTPGSSNIGVFRPGTATTIDVTGLPANSTIHVRLYSLFGATWFSSDYSYISGP